MVDARNCPIVEVTADGRACGRCWYYLLGPENTHCQRHGDVSREVAVYVRDGALTRGDARLAEDAPHV